MTIIETDGFLIDARWVGRLAATRYEPEEPGELYIDEIVVEDASDALGLLRQLSIMDYHPEEGEILVNRGPMSKLFDWAINNETVREEAK